MRRSVSVLTLAAVVMLVAVTSVLAAPPAQPRNFTAPLRGAEEVLNGVVGIDTQARGVAIFQLSPDGNSLSYRLIASNIDDVFMAHIHCCAGPGVNAGIAVWLYPEGSTSPSPNPIDNNGTLATGTITAANLVGPLAGMSIADLVDRIVAGETYVNVHTTAFPGGEIRGQLP